MTDPYMEITERMRQILANDHNAADVYQALSKEVNDQEIAKMLATLAEEELRHIKMDNNLIALLERGDE